MQDSVRQTSQQTIQELQSLGIQETVMLTGDNQATANQIAKEVGVSSVKANLMPADKLQEIQNLQTTLGRVAMIGDGVNDAPALAIANVGIAMGVVGTDTALETADVTLMGDDLSKLPLTTKKDFFKDYYFFISLESNRLATGYPRLAHTLDCHSSRHGCNDNRYIEWYSVAAGEVKYN